MDRLIGLIRDEGYSLAVFNGGISAYGGRGISDLYRLLKDGNGTLRGALVADKVVGKGAAALMVLGGVKEVFAMTISVSALDLLEKSGVRTEYCTLVPNIINREGTDICPVEGLCSGCETAADCLPLIERFVSGRIF